MIRRLSCVGLSMAAAIAAFAATQPIYINNSPVMSPPDLAPQIDATAFVNRSKFSISNFFTTLPYQTLNTLYFTNTSAGMMFGDPGFRFDFFTNNTRLLMNSWVNQGMIDAGTWLLVSSTNIISTGTLNAGPAGIVRLTGKDVSLRRGGLRTGTSQGAIFGGGFTFGTNYTSAVGVSDIYWGAGTNDHVDDRGMAMQLTGFSFDALNYTPPFFESPFHQVIDGRFFTPFTNLVSVGGFNYGAFVHRAQLSSTSSIVQIVFAPTNNFDTNFSTEVRFFTNFGSPVAIPVVQFRSTDLDIVTARQNTNAVYLVDYAGSQTNIFLARPLGGGTTRRPVNYDLLRAEPFEFTFGGPGNTVYDPALIYNATYQLAAVTNTYAGYAAQVTSAAFTNVGGIFSDPTNFSGRIEINADSVDLDQARIRAETTIIIRTSDLSGNKVGKVDAPFLNYDLTSLEPELVISNLAPTTVRRLSGQIAAWTGKWKNYEITATATNEIEFHVLIVDNFLSSTAPVVLSEFAARAPQVVINDRLSVRKALRIEATDLTITGGLDLPFGANWAHTNIVGVYYFTNSGAINVTQSAFFGADPADSYLTFINRGNIGASSAFVRAEDFQNSGGLAANGGVLSVEADTALLHGPPTVLFTSTFTNFFGTVVTTIITNSFGPKLASSSDLEISARVLSVSNSVFQAGVSTPGALIVSVSESLTDSGLGAINHWSASAGLQMLTLPSVSDLLATHVTSTVEVNGEASHLSPAVDFGATARGFENNLALGKLTLDALGAFSLMRFAGHGVQCALYVDYLEFLNYATNDTATIEIADNLTIYFANANVAPGKIDGSHNGRLRWVKDFAGPLSSTNITYPSGRTYTFNSALVQDKDLDSDGDGIVNGEDPTPIYAEDHVDLSVAPAPAPSTVLVSWYTLQNSFNQLEYRNSIDSGPWQVLTNFAHSTASGRVTVQVPTPGISRFYRVRVDPPSN